MAQVNSFVAHHYVATALKSSAVLACGSGNFTSPSDLNLIVAKNTHLEIYLVTPEGVRTFKEVSMYGKIAAMKVFRFPNDSQDVLFILTARYNAMILECVGEGKNTDIITKAYGCINASPVPSKTQILAVIDPEARVIGIHLGHRLFKIIPLEKDNSELKVYDMRMKEAKIECLEFLYGCANPTIIFIHQYAHCHQVQTLEISFRDKKFVNTHWKANNFKTEPYMVIPVPLPLGGALSIGREYILYVDSNTYVAIAPTFKEFQQNLIACYTRLDADGTRYLLGDTAGHLFLIILEKGLRIDWSTVVKDLKLEFLGNISVPECITYLGHGILFVGSCFGDSQLIKLIMRPNERGYCLSTLKTFTSLAPILDMVVVDLGEGQGQVVTCSGAYKDGSLRIISHDVEIQEHTSIDLPGIKGMWALRVNSVDQVHNNLVLTFVGETRVLNIKGEVFKKTKLSGFDPYLQSLFCGNVDYDQIIQITTLSARLISRNGRQLVHEWLPPCFKAINVVACNTNQVVCAAGSDLYYLEINKKEIVHKGSATMEHEVACVDVTPLEEGSKAVVVAVGLWVDASAHILMLPELKEVCREYFSEEILLRSILVTCFEGINYLFCGLGGGSMCYFHLNKKTGTLTDKEKITVGTKPTVLRTFSSHSTTYVSACSDRITVIYSSNRKLSFTNMNMKDVKHMCSVNTKAYPDSLALATESIMTVITVGEIKRFQIKTVPLGEAPRKIAYQESSQTFGVISMRFDIRDDMFQSPERPSVSTQAPNMDISLSSIIAINKASFVEKEGLVEVFSLLIFDQHTFKVLHAIQFLQSEFALSVISSKLGEDPNTYYIVGTSVQLPDGSYPRSGRIVVFLYQDGVLVQVTEKDVRGACHELAVCHGRLVANVNDEVQFFQWTGNVLNRKSTFTNGIDLLYLKAKGDFVVVGDICRFMVLLKYKTTRGGLEPVARNCSPYCTTALEFLEDGMVLGAEKSRNLVVCKKEWGESQELLELGLFHLGDSVNVIRRGSLVKQPVGATSTWMGGCVIFGTFSGAIGFVTQIPPDFYFLHDVEEKLTQVFKSVGMIKHSLWRSFTTKNRKEACKGIIDGDLVERFLDLSPEKMGEVALGLQIDSGNGTKREATVYDIVKRVEMLARMH